MWHKKGPARRLRRAGFTKGKKFMKKKRMMRIPGDKYKTSMEYKIENGHFDQLSPRTLYYYVTLLLFRNLVLFFDI